MPPAEDPENLASFNHSSLHPSSSKLTTSLSFKLSQGRDLSRPYASLRSTCMGFLFNFSSRQNPRILLEDARARLVEAQAESYELGVQKARLEVKMQTLRNEGFMVEAHRDMKREETWKLWVVREVLFGVLRMWDSIVG